MRVDLNADVGEGLDVSGSLDAALLQSVSSASVACGFHAGTAETMRNAVELARKCGVVVGAHPGFADREGFGRRDMHLAPDEVEDLVRAQLETLAAIATAAGVRLRHVKPHGALYNMAAREPALAAAIARAVKYFDPSLIVVGLAGSALVSAAERHGLRAAGEGFADRTYQADGSLVPRTEPGAVITDPAAVLAQALGLISGREFVSPTGARVRPRVDTLCLHGDTPGAPELAATLRSGLLESGVEVRALTED